MKRRWLVTNAIGFAILSSHLGCSESKEAVKPSTFAPPPPKNTEATPEGGDGGKINAVSDG